MYKETVTYEDYNGIERTEDFYFNLTKAELYEMELSTPGGMTEYLTKIVNAQEATQIMAEFKKLLLMSYGKKTEDGRGFLKTPAIKEEFEASPAYSILFMNLAMDDKKASAFINGIIPKDLNISDKPSVNPNLPPAAPIPLNRATEEKPGGAATPE